MACELPIRAAADPEIILRRTVGSSIVLKIENC